MPLDPFTKPDIELPPDGNPRRRVIVPSENVKCPWCGAKPGEKCFSENSVRATPHRVRRLALEVSLGFVLSQAKLDKQLADLKRRENNRLNRDNNS